jgi:hypothetical protein
LNPPRAQHVVAQLSSHSRTQPRTLPTQVQPAFARPRVLLPPPLPPMPQQRKPPIAPPHSPVAAPPRPGAQIQARLPHSPAPRLTAPPLQRAPLPVAPRPLAFPAPGQVRSATAQLHRAPAAPPRLPAALQLRHPQAPGAPFVLQAHGLAPRYGGSEVVQPFWGYAGYVYDTISAVGIGATIIATIATLCKASGLGWLAPLFIPAIGTFLQAILVYEGKQNNTDNLIGDGRAETYLGAVTTLVNTVAGAVGIMVGTGAVTAGIVTTVLVSLIMLVLEGLRIKLLNRQTVYEAVYNGIKAKCSGGVEGQNLLPNNN